ncbi:efflux transporter outer membrane subunit [Desulfotignum phosphitoxidans]|uniref:RND efflux system, outer membrane lipoprotein, NodT family n=1 Tax=Desulfotignum phosphitoxidans DSM 13687 TaxID=1286635 RepID=S0FQP2_9BACT|nr:efflux transporter outer membrane subunit [Desulfotignum phosphitoxidans]EMS77403.1 RND efflux system, outer membrane lipoprotein, NodT family [Desulfotignum phosphitoxidans DSM 13687]
MTRKRNKPFGLMLAFLSLLWAGCTVGPDYTPPEPRADMDQWQQPPEYGLVVSQADIGEWWQVFEDPRLNELVNRGLSGNLDLDIARSRIREARAARGIETAARFPAVTAAGSAAKVKEGDQPTGELYATDFDAAWEIDIFGRITRRIEASTADMQASIETLRSVQVSLVAELALNYTEVRSFQNRIRVAETNIDAQRKTLQIVTDRFDLQLANSLELEQAKSNLASSQSQLPPLKSGLQQAMNRIAVLTGEKPGVLNDFFHEASPMPTAPPEIAIGIPADLIRRRPDIRKAERELAAQSARVGIAKADLYPRFTFNGILQFSTTSASSLFDSMSRLLTIGPAFQWSIFNAGSVRSNIEVQSERQNQALIEYEQTILQALEDVESAMVAYVRELDRRGSMKNMVESAKKSANLAESLYKDGLRDFIYVLDAQRTLFTAEDSLAISSAEVTANLIRLYKALGGGWNPAHRNSK